MHAKLVWSVVCKGVPSGVETGKSWEVKFRIKYSNLNIFLGKRVSNKLSLDPLLYPSALL